MRISDWSSDVCSSDLRWRCRRTNITSNISRRSATGRATSFRRNRPLGPAQSHKESQNPFALSLSKGRSFFATPKERTVLRQAQHERNERESLWLCGFVRTDLMHEPRHHVAIAAADLHLRARTEHERSEEHTSELQYLMRNSYAVFYMKKK